MNTLNYKLPDVRVEAISDQLTLAEAEKLIDTLTNRITELKVRH